MNWRPPLCLSDIEAQAVREYIERHATRDENGCWLFGNSGAYYRKKFRFLKREFIHRLSCAAFHGTIEDGKEVCHTCDVPNCANPEHLFIGTAKDNAEDRTKKGRGVRGHTHPKSKLSEEDLSTIRSKYVSKECNQVELAAMFGVNQTAISFILRGVHYNGPNVSRGKAGRSHNTHEKYKLGANS